MSLENEQLYIFQIILLITLAVPPVSGFNPEAFLKYKEAKLKEIANIESKRLEDLKDARTTVFKYAIPTSIIDGVGGVVGTLITGNILLLLPVALFVIIIYLLADGLDRKKLAERIDIMESTEYELYVIARQEITLLRRAWR